jgi:hypothetical protein
MKIQIWTVFQISWQSNNWVVIRAFKSFTNKYDAVIFSKEKTAKKPHCKFYIAGSYLEIDKDQVAALVGEGR